MTKEAILSTFTLAQQLDPAFWEWKEDSDVIANGDLEGILNGVIERLEAHEMVISDAYGIIHDKDFQLYVDENGNEIRTDKAKHVHLAVRFQRDKNIIKGGTLPDISFALGVQPQYIEKLKKGRYSWDNCLAYLTHVKYPEKHLYEPSEVYTAKGVDYKQIYADRRDAWIKGRASIQKKKAITDIDYIEDLVLKGEITRQDLVLKDEYFSIYGRYRKRLNEALLAYGERKAMIAAEKLKRGEFKISIFYITGSPGAGKTQLAYQTCLHAQQALKDSGYPDPSVYKGASRNPLDDYSGEDIILLDDLRSDAMSPTEWLLLLDPYQPSPQSARYRNKSNVAPRVIIMTSHLSVEEFFFEACQRSKINEALDQFMRRLTAIIEVRIVRNQRYASIGEVVDISDNPDVYDYNKRNLHKLNFGIAVKEIAQVPFAQNRMIEAIAKNNRDYKINLEESDKKLLEPIRDYDNFPPELGGVIAVHDNWESLDNFMGFYPYSETLDYESYEYVQEDQGEDVIDIFDLPQDESGIEVLSS